MFGKKKEKETVVVQPQAEPEGKLVVAKKKATKAFKIALALVVTGLLLVLGGFLWFNYGTVKTESCTVTGKDRTQGTNQPSNFRVYTSPADEGGNCGTFQVQDTWWHANFNSADLYGRLEQGKTYEIKYNGIRNGFFSWFPNVLDVKPEGSK